MKKILCVLMTVILVAASVLTITASGVKSGDAVKLISVEHTYDNDTLNDIINGSFLSKGVNYTVSEGLTVYNSDTDTLFYVLPVMNGRFCVSTILADGADGYVLTSDTSIYNAVSELGAGEYILYITNGICYAESEENTVFLSDTGFNDFSNDNYIEIDFTEKLEDVEQASGDAKCLTAGISEMNNQICTVQTEVSSVNSASVMAAASDMVTNVCDIKFFMEQGKHNLCWAACCATIINYKKPHLFFDAFEIADICGVGYEDGGSESNMISVMRLYGVNYNTYDKIAWAQVPTNIDLKMPFIMGMYAYVNGEIKLHTVTGYGYSHAATETSDTSYMRTINVWDPNGQKLIFIHKSPTYNLYGYEWTWFRTISYRG